MVMRLLEVGKFSPTMQQRIQNRGDVWPEARLQHQLQERKLQAVRANPEERTAVPQNVSGCRAMEERGEPTGDDRED